MLISGNRTIKFSHIFTSARSPNEKLVSSGLVPVCEANEVSVAPFHHYTQRARHGDGGIRGWPEARGRGRSGVSPLPEPAPAARNENPLRPTDVAHRRGRRRKLSAAEAAFELPGRLENPFGQSPKRAATPENKLLRAPRHAACWAKCASAFFGGVFSSH
jgi:hypothetical protein